MIDRFGPTQTSNVIQFIIIDANWETAWWPIRPACVAIIWLVAWVYVSEYASTSWSGTSRGDYLIISGVITMFVCFAIDAVFPGFIPEWLTWLPT